MKSTKSQDKYFKQKIKLKRRDYLKVYVKELISKHSNHFALSCFNGISRTAIKIKHLVAFWEIAGLRNR